MKQDSIRFSLTAEGIVNNDTVKAVAQCVAIVLPTMTESTLKESFRSVTHALIPSAGWRFSNMVRSSHASGMEQVTLTASARIPESENYALDRRREEASQDGLRITSVSTDTSPTKQQMDATYSSLRLELIAMAQTEMHAINARMPGLDYRLARIDFDPMTDIQPTKRNMMAMSANYGSGFANAGPGYAAGDEGSDIGNAVKVSMQANVVLRRAP